MSYEDQSMDQQPMIHEIGWYRDWNTKTAEQQADVKQQLQDQHDRFNTMEHGHDRDQANEYRKADKEYWETKTAFELGNGATGAPMRGPTRGSQGAGAELLGDHVIVGELFAGNQVRQSQYL